MAFMKVFVIIAFAGFLVLNSISLFLPFRFESSPESTFWNSTLEDSKSPIQSTIPQQQSVEDFFVSDGDDEDNELNLPDGLLSSFQFLNSYPTESVRKVNGVSPHFSFIPLFLLFKSWKAFLL
jgi:hypothetical protein